MRFPLVLLLLLAARLAIAQEPAVKPSTPAPEPRLQRQTPSAGLIAVIGYNDAVNERDVLTQAVPELLRFIRESTELTAPLTWARMPLYDARVPQAVMLYLTGADAQMRLDEVERRALGDFLRGGGLVFAEDLMGGNGTPFVGQLKALVRDPLVLGSQGTQWQPIPNDHPLYSCFFDMPGGPPLTGAAGERFTRGLEGLEYHGRLAVIYSNLGLSYHWWTDAAGRESSLRLGTNLLVQALSNRRAGIPLRR
ncbi:MAG: DUF4159 domain-containing protein [Candidatus Latescibacterota bacterium]|jgi:hypothetical protein